MEHVAELRKRLTIAVLVVVVLSFVFYAEPLYKAALEIFLHPIKDLLPDGQLTVLGPFEQLTFRAKVAMFAAIIVGSPVIIYQMLAFLLPGLKDRERRWLVPTTLSAIFLFLMGAAFAYFVIMGPAFEWMASQGAGMVNSIPAAERYFSGIGMMLVGFGIGFELPLVVFYLIGLGIIRYDTIRASWRYAYVAVVIIASMATPDWSPWTMGGLAAALIALYESSLIAARFVFRDRIAGQRAEAAEEAAAAEADAIAEAKAQSTEARRQMLQERADAARRRAAEAEARAAAANAVVTATGATGIDMGEVPLAPTPAEVAIESVAESASEVAPEVPVAEKPVADEHDAFAEPADWVDPDWLKPSPGTTPVDGPEPE